MVALESGTFPPVHLGCCPLPVAVGAANVALGDLCHDDSERGRARESGNNVALRRAITMVEVEEHDVSLAAVDTWVASQIRVDCVADPRMLLTPTPSAALYIDGRIQSVVFAAVLAAAGSAPHLPQCGLLVLDPELVERLRLAAARAALRLVGCAHASLAPRCRCPRPAQQAFEQAFYRVVGPSRKGFGEGVSRRRGRGTGACQG